MQRSVRENIALPFSTRLRRWGLIDLAAERRTVDGAVATLQIDARAGGEVRRLSGGNQQKVTIARWVAGGVHTMLCFDPTRGIDIRTKQQIYVLLRDLAEAGAAVLLYTSELKEVQLVCDRAIVIFGGRVVAEIAGGGRRRARAAARRVQPALGRGDARGDRGRGGRRRRSGGRPCRHADDRRGPPATAADRRAPSPGDEPMSAAAAPVETRRAAVHGRARVGRAAQCLDPRPARVPRRAPRLHQAHPAELRGDRRSRGWRSRFCRSPWPPSPRRSSSSRAGSTSRSAR